MSAKKKADILIVGGEPRVDLLPPEVVQGRKAKVVRRRLGFGIIVSLAVIALAVGGSFFAAITAQAALLSAQDRTSELLLEQAQYSEVTRVQTHLQLLQAAQQVGVSTEIAWEGYLQQVQATLPAGVTIVTVDIDSATPIAAYPQPSVPLQGARWATISFTAESAALPDVPVWLRGLATLPGYADAQFGSATLNAERGVYTVAVTLHVNDAAFSGRFAPVDPNEEAAAAEEATTGDPAASSEEQ